MVCLVLNQAKIVGKTGCHSRKSGVIDVYRYKVIRQSYKSFKQSKMRQKITIVFTTVNNFVKKLKLVKSRYIVPFGMDELTITIKTYGALFNGRCNSF